MKLKNLTADYYLTILKTIAPKVSGRFGYAVARNIRELSLSLSEYTQFKNRLIAKYGVNDGKEITLSVNSDEFPKYKAEMSTYEGIEHDLDLMLVSPEDVFKTPLTADDMASIMFMIKEE